MIMLYFHSLCSKEENLIKGKIASKEQDKREDIVTILSAIISPLAKQQPKKPQPNKKNKKQI